MSDESVTPAEAFSLLGNEQRLAILETLWDVGEPLPFSGLRESVGIEDSGQFNYHLGQLEGLYVREVDDGYDLTRPGRRVLTAVLAGDLLDRPDIGPTRVDWPCPLCGADVELRFEDEMLRINCRECHGLFEGPVEGRDEEWDVPGGTISLLPIPPAGVEAREPAEVVAAAFEWIWHRATMAATGMCPECSGPISAESIVCEDHDTDEGLCGSCNRLHAALAYLSCETCGASNGVIMGTVTWADARVRHYFQDHRVDVTHADPETLAASVTYDETVHGTEPLNYELEWTIDDETLRVRMGDGLALTAVDRISD